MGNGTNHRGTKTAIDQMNISLCVSFAFGASSPETSHSCTSAVISPDLRFLISRLSLAHFVGRPNRPDQARVTSPMPQHYITKTRKQPTSKPVVDQFKNVQACLASGRVESDIGFQIKQSPDEAPSHELGWS